MLSPKLDEANPIRTDVAVAELANIGKDTLRKIERMDLNPFEKGKRSARD